MNTSNVQTLAVKVQVALAKCHLTDFADSEDRSASRLSHLLPDQQGGERGLFLLCGDVGKKIRHDQVTEPDQEKRL